MKRELPHQESRSGTLGSLPRHARQLEAAMKQQKLSRAEMARRMQTSRAALHRLLDPENDAVTLSTLRKAAIAVGREIRLELV